MNDNLVEIIWQKATKVENYEPNKWRKDFAGAWIQRSQFGIRSEFGWEIDHIVPKSRGGSDEPGNLIPMHWRNNVAKSDNYPNFTSIVSSNGNMNVDLEQSWQISK
jgi:5-methylcytosine-specific restriction endonuclease McrA